MCYCIILYTTINLNYFNKLYNIIELKPFIKVNNQITLNFFFLPLTEMSNESFIKCVTFLRRKKNKS